MIFNAVCFLTPRSVTVSGVVYTKFDASFWAAYAVVMLAFVGNYICARHAFKAPDARRFFYNVPLITISYTAVILTLVFGAAVVAIPNLPSWIGIVLCLAVLLFNVLALVKATAAAELVEGVDEKISAQTAFIKTATVEAESLMSRAASPEAKAACKKVYEALRYSDPMSNDALSGVESQITLKFNEFSNAVTSGAEDIGSLADELVVLIGDRNKKCKLLK